MMSVRKRIASIILSMMVLVTAMPAVNMTVYAGEADEAQTTEVQATEPAKEENSGREAKTEDSNDEAATDAGNVGSAGASDVAGADAVQNEAQDANKTEVDDANNAEAKSYSEDFTVNPGEKTSEVTRISYSDYNGDHSVNMYTVRIPADADSIKVDFGGQELIAYGYADAGKATYLKSCSNSASGAYANSGKSGETTAVIRGENGDFPGFVWVQSPYDDDWHSTDLYVIKVELDETAGDGENGDSSGDADSDSAISKVDVDEALEKTRSKAKSQMSNTFGDEWVVMGLAREGQTVSEQYYKSMYETVAENRGSLETGRTSYTNNARAIIGLTASGFDATNVAGYNLVAKLSDYDAIVAQGINGPIFALLALDSHNYEIPEAKAGVTQATRENLVKFILDKSFNITKAGGNTYTGWAYRGNAEDPDVDMTAMAMMALAPYKDNPDVAAKLAGAEKFLKDKYTREEKSAGKVTKPAGTYGNSNSVASAIIGLTSIGVDPASFISGEYPSLIDNLNSFLVKTGGFGYTSNKSYDRTATNDGYRALVAIQRMKKGQSTIYNMNDISSLSILGADGKAKTDASGDDSGKDSGGDSGKKTDDGKSTGTTDKKDNSTGKDKRHLRFVQGNGGRALITDADSADEDAKLSDAGKSKTGKKYGTGDTKLSDASTVAEGGAASGMGKLEQVDYDLTKPLMFAGAGFIFLILALIVLSRLVKLDKKEE